MTKIHYRLIGAPVDSGRVGRGCLMGPDAMRTARLADALADLGHDVTDMGNLSPDDVPGVDVSSHVHAYAETAG